MILTEKRQLYVLIGTITMLFAGFIYAWSILSAPIAVEFPHWTSAQLSLVFTLCMAFFCLGGIAAGVISKHISARVNLFVSAVLFLIGFFMISRLQHLSTLYVAYGILCGTASGFAYNSVMNLVPRWYPEKQGLISGVLLMGFGASSMVIGSVFSAVTQESADAWRTSLLVMGTCIAVVVLLGALFLKQTKSDEVLGCEIRVENARGLDLTPVAMLRRASFWRFYLWALLLSAAGLIVISQARTIAQEVDPTMNAGLLSFIVGMLSIFNGLGRVIFGFLFDRGGRKTTMCLIAVTGFLGALLLLLATVTHTRFVLTIAFALVGAAYGAGPTMCAAVTKEFYGQKNYSINYPLVNSNLFLASFASTLAGVIYDKAGNYFFIYALLLVLLGIDFLLQLHIRRT